MRPNAKAVGWPSNQRSAHPPSTLPMSAWGGDSHGRPATSRASKALLETEVKARAEAFLEERGLRLSPKAAIVTYLTDGFDFTLYRREQVRRRAADPTRERALRGSDAENPGHPPGPQDSTAGRGGWETQADHQGVAPPVLGILESPCETRRLHVAAAYGAGRGSGAPDQRTPMGQGPLLTGPRLPHVDGCRCTAHTRR